MAQPWKHPISGIYYLRLRVPEELREVVGRREQKVSLKTRDPAEVKQRHAQAMVDAQQLFARARTQLRGEVLLSDADVEQLAARWFREEAGKMEARASYRSWLVQGETAAVQSGSECEEVAIDQSLRTAVEDDDDFALTDHIARHVEQALRDANLPKPPRDSAVWKRLELAFREHLLKLSDLALQRRQGNWGATSEVLPHADLAIEQVSDQPAREDGGLLALFEKYAEDKRLNDGDTRSVRKTVDAYRSFVVQFTELAGDLPLHKITRETIRDYRALLVRLPSRGDGVRALSGPQLIAKADAEGLPRISAQTVRNKLRALSAVLSHGVRMGAIAENPIVASGISRAAAKAATAQNVRNRRRKDYTHEELGRIFTSPIYQANGWSAAGSDLGAAWFWLPLLMYYTGARREELAQLAVRDVLLSGGRRMVDYLSILSTGDDDGERGVKTVGSRRTIPLHDDLLARGFMTYVRTLPPGGQLFPLLKPNPQGFFGANFGKRWGKYLREVVGLSASASPSHGFRHTFKTLCREAEIPEEVHDAITGHTGSGRGGRGYGEVPLLVMADALDRYPVAVTPPLDAGCEIQSL